jgi:translation initiation factor 2 alpha subunit (eIF-2alpha)
MVYLYYKKFPKIDDIVKAKIEKIDQLGIEVTLPEYDNLNGYITYNEASRKKNFNINKIFTVGCDVNLIVINVDRDKKYIDLSKRTISDHESDLFSVKLKKYMVLYNMWKYIYQRYWEIFSDIDNNEFDKFLNCTLWKLLQLKNDDTEYIYSICINNDKNSEIIDLLEANCVNESYSLNYNKVKKILDDYIKIKINVIKPEKEIVINILSFAENGLNDIKQILDYKNYYFYEDIKEDFIFEILYQVNSKYKIIIKQKDFIITNPNYNINNIEEKVIDLINDKTKNYTDLMLSFS